MRSTEDWSRLGGFVIAGLAVLVSGLVLVPRFLGLAAGPEVEIITALKRTESEGLRLQVPGASHPLVSRRHHFARITVVVAPDGARAEAHATLDFDGALGDTEVGTAGVERVPFVRRDGDWEPESSAAPRLVAVVAALEARRRAVEVADGAALERRAGPGVDGGLGPEWEQLRRIKGRRYQAESWYVRLERDDALVTEHWRLRGDLPEKPVDTQGQRRLTLTLHGDEFLFSPGLM